LGRYVRSHVKEYFLETDVVKNIQRLKKTGRYQHLQHARMTPMSIRLALEINLYQKLCPGRFLRARTRELKIVTWILFAC
jgi:hypothetical protein